MKIKHIIPLPLVGLLLLTVYSIPFNWFKVGLDMPKVEVYELCGPPSSLEVEDVKGEYWKSSGPLWEWKMYVGLTKNEVSYSRIYLHIGPRSHDIRLYVMNDGKWDLHI